MSKKKNDVSQKLMPNTSASDDDGSATDLRQLGFNAWGAEQGNLYSHLIEPPDGEVRNSIGSVPRWNTLANNKWGRK